MRKSSLSKKNYLIYGDALVVKVGFLLLVAIAPTQASAWVYGYTQVSSTVSVDLAVRELAFAPDQPDAGSEVDITALVLNLSNVSAPLRLVFVIDEKVIETGNRTASAFGFVFLKATWIASAGSHSLRAEVFPAMSNYQDLFPDNNLLRRNINVAVPSYVFTVAISENLLGQTRLFVDEVFWGLYKGGDSIPLVFAKDSAQHNITVDREINPLFGVIYITKEPTLFVNQTGRYSFSYDALYLLQVGSNLSEARLPMSLEWYPANSTVQLPIFDKTVEEPGRRFVFKSWNLDGKPYEQPAVFMDKPHFAQAQYEAQYYLTVKLQNNQSGCAFATAQGWYPAGSTVNAFTFPSSCWWSGLLGRVLGLLSNSTTSSSSVVMTEPTTIYVAWSGPSGPDVLRAFLLMLGWIIVIVTNIGKIKSLPKLMSKFLRSRKTK